MKWAGFDTLDGHPTLITLPDRKATVEEKDKFLMDVIGKFTEEYVMTEFDREKSWRKQQQNEEKSGEDQTLHTSASSVSIEDSALEELTSGTKLTQHKTMNSI
jgi:hypothetical protein